MTPRSFLFLQGPPGPLFHLLGGDIIARGINVHRINLNGGDVHDWPDAAVDYTGPFTDWPVFLDRFLRVHRITDLMLFGDCRPYHVTARGIAAKRGIAIHVLEEGYIRPDWMTLEPEGVNGHSTLPHDSAWFIKQAAQIPAIPELPRITASFRRRIRDSFSYYFRTWWGVFRFPYYRSHRPGTLFGELVGWGWKYLRRHHRARTAETVFSQLGEDAFFILPLQLGTDYQIRAHSPFPNMVSAASYIFESFAGHAPPEARLLVKAHPLECGFFNWPGFIRREAKRLGLQGRLFYVDGGDLERLAENAQGMVCVNSTSGTLALIVDTPVCVLGDAIYDMPGITHQGHLDTFWKTPTPPDPKAYDAFRRVLHHLCLVRGGLASQSAIDTLRQSILDRLLTKAGTVSDFSRPISQSSIAAKWPAQSGGR